MQEVEQEEKEAGEEEAVGERVMLSSTQATAAAQPPTPRSSMRMVFEMEQLEVRS
jgi:hypothetical protein